MYNAVIFSDATEPAGNLIYDKLPPVPLRSAGPYRIATETRNHGLSAIVINFLFTFSDDEVKIICKKFITDNTLIVGISSTYWNILSDHQKNTLQLIFDYCRKYPKLKVIVGGYNVKILNIFKPDKVFKGYAESEYSNFLSESFNAKPFTDFSFNESKIQYIKEDFLVNDELVVIEIARGCIFKCSFCAFPLNGKTKFDYIKYKNILREEFIKNYEMFGITKYQFADDTLNDSTEKLEMLHSITLSLPFKIKFSAYIRTDLLYAHQEQIPLLKEIGLSSAFLGIETFNKESGKKIGKSMDGNKVKEFLYDLKTKHWGNQVKIIVALISGLPGESEQSHKETADWILDTNYNLVDRIRANPLYIPNPLHDVSIYKSNFEINASKYGFYWPDPKSPKWKNLSNYVKSFDQAYELSKELTDCARITDRDTHTTNFLSLAAWSTLTENPVSFEYLENLSRKEYKHWFTNNSSNLTQKYLKHYKSKILDAYI